MLVTRGLAPRYRGKVETCRLTPAHPLLPALASMPGSDGAASLPVRTLAAVGLDRNREGPARLITTPTGWYRPKPPFASTDMCIPQAISTSAFAAVQRFFRSLPLAAARSTRVQTASFSS